MREILAKISSYNLFNYLLPGVLFAVILQELGIYSFIQDDLIIGVFVYYFIGLVVSRFGSLIVEPFLKKITFLKFVKYKDFVFATKKDSKIEILSEASNMYRTFVSMISMILILKIYKVVEYQIPELQDWNPLILSVLLLIMFLFSYRKQSQYITKRIKSHLK